MTKKAATKDGLPRKSFAYAPTADPATWKLPYLDAKGKPDPDHLPGAAAALSEGGFRGEKASIDAKFLPMVKSKLRQAYRRWKGADAEYPDGIRESVYGTIEESDAEPGLTIREATILIDKSPVSAQVITSPNGDTLVIPCWTGAFDDLAKPWVPYSPNDSYSAAFDAADAAELIPSLIRLKRGEADEPEQAALIDAAISAISAFVKAETAEITTDDVAESAADQTVFEHALREAGRRNSSKDAKMIQTIHDYTHTLGAEHDGQQRKLAEAEVDPLAPENSVSFREATVGDAIVTLAEAGAVFDDEKKQVWITPIKPGFGNARDNFFYPDATLREATEAGLFNGVKMFRNHPRKSDEKDLPERSVTDWFGVVKESRWDEAQGRPRALVQVFEEADWNRFKAAPDQVAFSVLGQGKARPGKVDGRDARVIESFTQVRSVDWVTTAGAGGAIEFAESASDEEFEMDIKDMTVEQLTSLKESNPAVYAHLVGLAKALPADDTEPTAPPVPPTPPTEPTEPAPTPEPKVAVAEADATPEQKREALIDQLLADRAERVAADARTARITEAQAVVKAALKDTTLPKVATDAIEEKFAESGFGDGFVYADEKGLKAALDREVAATSKLLGSLKGYAPRATGLGSPSDDNPSATVREAVFAKMERRWGVDVIPKPDPTAVWTGKSPEDDSTEKVEKPVAANITEAARPVESRLDVKWGNG